MLPNLQETQQPATKNTKNTHRTNQLHTSKFKSRTPSREFNNPIYAGFDIHEENWEHTNWGPWTASNELPLRNSHSLHSNLNKAAVRQPIQLHSLSVTKKSLIPFMEEFRSKSPTRNGMPEVKKKGKHTFVEFKLPDHDLKALKKMSHKDLKLRAGVFTKKSEPNYLSRAEERFRNLNMKPMGTVVYNYCTNREAEECLFIYERKSEPFLDRLGRMESLTKYEGLRSLWSKRNSPFKPSEL